MWRHRSLPLPLVCSLLGRGSSALGAVVVELTEWDTGVVLCILVANSWERVQGLV